MIVRHITKIKLFLIVASLMLLNSCADIATEIFSAALSPIAETIAMTVEAKLDTYDVSPNPRAVLKFYDSTQIDSPDVSILHGNVFKKSNFLGMNRDPIRIESLDNEKVRNYEFEILPEKHSVEIVYKYGRAIFDFSVKPRREYAPMAVKCKGSSFLEYMFWIEDWGEYNSDNYKSEINIVSSQDLRFIASDVKTINSTIKIQSSDFWPNCYEIRKELPHTREEYAALLEGYNSGDVVFVELKTGEQKTLTVVNITDKGLSGSNAVFTLREQFPEFFSYKKIRKISLVVKKDAQDIPAEKLYTTYNMWYESPRRMQCINYKVGTMIPAGSRVSSAKLIKEGFYQNGSEMIKDLDDIDHHILFVLAGEDQEYKVYFHKGYHRGKKIKDYFSMMFDGQPLDTRVSGFSDEEQATIRGGYLVEGMSREAVLMAYGYPPEHKTPNLESTRWVYWMNKRDKKTINFDLDGRTIKKEKIEQKESL